MYSVSRRLPLPESWPESVNTAVLHVISLAHMAIVHGRRLVVNSPSARTRLAGDLQGLLDEISLLNEELRIKDARMAMIDPHCASPATLDPCFWLCGFGEHEILRCQFSSTTENGQKKNEDQLYRAHNSLPNTLPHYI